MLMCFPGMGPQRRQSSTHLPELLPICCERCSKKVPASQHLLTLGKILAPLKMTSTNIIGARISPMIVRDFSKRFPFLLIFIRSSTPSHSPLPPLTHTKGRQATQLCCDKSLLELSKKPKRHPHSHEWV